MPTDIAIWYSFSVTFYEDDEGHVLVKMVSDKATLIDTCVENAVDQCSSTPETEQENVVPSEL